MFTAMQVCLYGHYTFGLKSGGKIYLNEISKLINNRSRLDETKICTVEITFTEQNARDLDTYTVRRGWTWQDGEVCEGWFVTKNWVDLDDEQRVNFQNYLLHLIPPDMLRLYFFDGEKIADYFLEEHHGNIRNALMILSGNDTFEILRDAIKRIIHLDKSIDQTKAKEYIDKREAVQKLEMQIGQMALEINNLQKQVDEAEASMEKAAADYNAKGGISLDQWKSLNDKIQSEEMLREKLNVERKTLATDILPFLIVSNLVGEVKPQIFREKQERALSAMGTTLQSDSFVRVLTDELVKMGYKPSIEQSETLSKKISNYFLSQQQVQTAPLFGLSEDDEMQILATIDRFENNTSTIQDCMKKINKSLARTKQLRKQLQSSSIENLEDHLRTIAELTEDKTKSSFYLEQRILEQNQLNSQLEVQNRELKNSKKDFENELQQSSVQSISGKILLLLDTLHERIYDRLILQVQFDVNRKLKEMIRKEQFIDGISIDHDFNIHLLRKQNISASFLFDQLKKRGSDGLNKVIGVYACKELYALLNTEENHLVMALSADGRENYLLPLEINQNKLSNGEKQIFVMSLYWALMQQSQHSLPFIIDTPFARIDSEHRRNITRHFFSELNGQLFVLSTDEELDDEHLATLDDQVSDVYLLEYDSDKRTIIHENQYFEGQIRLWGIN